MAQLHFGPGDSTTFGTKDSQTSLLASFDRGDLYNMQIGDLLVAYIQNQSGATGTSITAPSGWVRYGPDIGQPNYPTSRLSGFYYYPIKSQADINNLPSTITWQFSIAGSRVVCVVARATGIDLDNIEDAAATSFTGGSSNSTSVAIGGITTVSTNTLLVGAVYHHNSASTDSPNTSSFMTDFEEYRTADDGTSFANSGVALGYDDLAASGATGTRTATFDKTATASGGALVAFKVAGWSGPSPVGQSVKYTSAPDTLSDGFLHYTSAPDILSVPAEVKPVSTGYDSVTAMLGETTFYLAHRGGGAYWPEMSLHAYTQSVFWGGGALELSLQRTSDGVWFGVHDPTLDRTSGTSGFNISEHTWAEVQAYQITAAETTNPSQATRPYMTFEEIMNTYYDSHVIFIDPKESVTFASELLDMMDALPGDSTQKLVAKYYGPATTWADLARARGYKAWGYFYEVNSGVLATYEGNYDILGMEYDASASVWTTITGFGKPVIGHVVTTSAQANTAISKGAAGLMVSGVPAIIPRV